MLRTIFLITSLLMSASSGSAQSSLGIDGAELSLSQTGAGGSLQRSFRATADVRITEFHGSQFDLGYTKYDGRALGEAMAHLYLAPKPSQKYGIFAAYSDADNSGDYAFRFGVEGMVALSPNWIIDGATGFGALNPGMFDFLYAGLGIEHRLNSHLNLRAQTLLAEYDEVGFYAIGSDTSLTAIWTPNHSPADFTFGINRLGLDGASGQKPILSATASVTLRIGQSPDTRRPLKNRRFAAYDPLIPLLRRNLP